MAQPTTSRTVTDKITVASMSVADMFSTFLSNLAIDNVGAISTRYGEITSALNKEFRDTESKTANSLQVGSFGRKTGIKGISDLDMLYIMPKAKWDTYKNNKQAKLLQDARTAILGRYPTTKVKVDRLVVTVTYSNFHMEVQPVFENEDQSYTYPDTAKGGSWKVTKPRQEMNAFPEMDKNKNHNLRRLCKMGRAWKNKHGVGMGGLLLDTLAYNFLNSTNEYDEKGFPYYDWLSRDFFKYLSELPKQDRYNAPGSGQHVKVKKAFQRKAKKAYELSLRAIEAEEKPSVNDRWRKIFGRPFPVGTSKAEDSTVAKEAYAWRNTEEFIEDRYPIDIRYSLEIDCEVKQNGFRENTLRRMLTGNFPLLAAKSLEFWIADHNIPGNFSVEWKILNRGSEARRRDQIRGQIVLDGGRHQKIERTLFRGNHVAECYAIKNGVVVAKNRIDVPIQSNG